MSLVPWSAPIVKGRFVAREKRFLAHCLVEGRPVVAHCADPGRMTGLLIPGAEVWLTPATGRGRKLAWTWRAVVGAAGPIGVHTQLPNAVVAAALAAGRLPPLRGYRRHTAEVFLGYKRGQRRRADFRLEGRGRPCWVEVKGVSMWAEDGRMAFPDAPTRRGLAQLEALEERLAAGERAVVIYLVQRPEIGLLRPADEIDPAYGAALRRAHRAGLELYAWRAILREDGVDLGPSVPILLPGAA